MTALELVTNDFARQVGQSALVGTLSMGKAVYEKWYLSRSHVSFSMELYYIAGEKATAFMVLLQKKIGFKNHVANNS